MPKRRSEVEIGASSRRLDPQLRRARRKFERFGRNVKDSLGKAFRGARGGLTSLEGLAGIGAIGAAAKQVYDFERRIDDLMIALNKTPQEMQEFRDLIREIGVETGQGADRVSRGAEAYVKLMGTLDPVALREIAKAATATGSSMEDLAGIAFSLNRNLGLDPSQFKAAFGVVAAAGKEGSVELRDMAAHLTRVAPNFAQFGDIDADGLVRLAAMLQVVRQESAGPETTVQSLNDLLAKTILYADRLREHGIEVFEEGPNGVKQARDIADIFEDIANSKLATDPEILGKVFSDMQARKAARALLVHMDQWKALEDQIRGTSDTIEKDFAKRQKTASFKVGQSWAKVQNKIADVFTPERIDKMADALVKLVDVMTVMVDHMEELIVLFAAWKASGFLGDLPGMGGGGGGGKASKLSKGAGFVAWAATAFLGGEALGGVLWDATNVTEAERAKMSEFERDRLNLKEAEDILRGNKVARAHPRAAKAAGMRRLTDEQVKDYEALRDKLTADLATAGVRNFARNKGIALPEDFQIRAIDRTEEQLRRMRMAFDSKEGVTDAAIRVMVVMDELGMLRAETKKDDTARRSPPP